MSGSFSADIEPNERVLLKLGLDRPLAHRVLFHTRHPDASPPFHDEMIEDWHGPAQWVMHMAFRGAAKSTLAEEAIIIRALYREFRNAIIFGSSFDRAAERLYAIRRQLEKNDTLIELFGSQKGPVWTDDRLILANDVTVRAMGRGQALRGTKDDETRPDLVLADDVEDKQSVRTPDARRGTLDWFMNDLIPAMDPAGRLRMTATPLDVESLAETLAKPGTGFVVRRYPIEYLDEAGRRAPTWPGRFPLSQIDIIRRRHAATGTLAEYNMEYMVRAEAPEAKPFKREQFRTDAALVQSWHPTYGIFDPARTVSRTAADTGYVAVSWVANRLIVWDAWGKQLQPDEIVSAVFEEDDRYRFTAVGVDQVGLNEFLLQPLRHEMAKRRQFLLLNALAVPKAKTERIRALQPFFNAREVWFAKPLPDLESQLLNFPTGKRDILDALAYALFLRPGAPVYEDFGGQHVLEEMEPIHGRPAFLALNATRAIVTGVLCQSVDGLLRVYADWIREGDPGAVLGEIVREANLAAGRQVKLACGPLHFDRYNNVGLVQAIKRLPMDCTRGGAPEEGRTELRALLGRQHRGVSAVLVGHDARWSLGGFAGGYARQIAHGGTLTTFAAEGPYRVLMEGLESFAALLRLGSPGEERDDIVWATSSDGRRYISARARR